MDDQAAEMQSTASGFYCNRRADHAQLSGTLSPSTSGSNEAGCMLARRSSRLYLLVYEQKRDRSGKHLNHGINIVIREFLLASKLSNCRANSCKILR